MVTNSWPEIDTARELENSWFRIQIFLFVEVAIFVAKVANYSLA